MNASIFSDRIKDVPKSFIREILKVTAQDDIISFAGGLPNKDLFPVANLKASAIKAFDTGGTAMLQYSPSEGYKPLREYIARRYKLRFNLNIKPGQIIILNGSQQGLDLTGKVFINEKDSIIIEEPGYLGAIQAYSLFLPKFKTVPLQNDGIDPEKFSSVMQSCSAKLFYTVPNFQNPSGISYSDERRKQVADIIAESNTLIVEDDPYGELRYSGKEMCSFANLIPEQTILLGSFSKIVVPGFRLGWIVLPEHLFEKVLIAKQAADLHSNQFAQRVLYQFIEDYDLNKHIDKIKHAYGSQCNAMIEAIQKHFPADVEFTRPEGGMFLWVTLSKGKSAMELFHKAIKEKVAFVPGDPFYIGKKNVNTFRLNFSCSSPTVIDEGIRRLGKVIREL
jgi:2-aminoadipate transaminase